MKVGRVFYFDSAHHLPEYDGTCEKHHGHTYTLDVVLEGDIGEDGMVLDFTKLKNVVQKEILSKLDHTDLNDIFENPTAENMVDWIYDRLKDKLSLHSVKLWEGRDKWVQRQSA